jgi:hypothetical protein
MLDQYQGVIDCVVNHNDGCFAECDILAATSTNPEASIDDEYWIGPSEVQVHAETLGLSEEQFLEQYPVGKRFRMELTVRVIDESSTETLPAQNASIH